MGPPLPGRKPASDISGDVPNLFTAQETNEENETEATPEELDQYEMIVTRVGKMIATEPSHTQVMNMMKGDNKDIPTAVGMAAAKLFLFAEKTAKSQGVELTPAAANSAFVQELLPMLIDEGQGAGLWSIKPGPTPDERSEEWLEIHQAATIIAADFVGQAFQKEGRMPTEEARKFLKSKGVTEDQMVPPGMTPVAGAVRKDAIRRQMGY